MSYSKRSKHGVVHYEVDKAYKGFTVFSPLGAGRCLEARETSPVFLMDMNGDFVHKWEVPGAVRMHADLLENGHIVCSTSLPGRIPEDHVNIGFNVSTTIELDWDGNVVWEYDNYMQDCHDRCRLPNGNTVIMVCKPLDPELQSKVQGGLPGSEVGGSNTTWAPMAGQRNANVGSAACTGDMEADDVADAGDGTMYTLVLTEVTPQNEIVWEMDLSQALDPEIDIISPNTGRSLWPGLSSVELCPDGNLISTSYNLDNVYIWDVKNKTVKWRFHSPKNPLQQCSFPHDPHQLENGNVLFFDNGRFHAADPSGKPNFFPPDFSRVVEVNPETDEIVWDYRDATPTDFYSTYISSAQRLPNGNTLIDEGATGRFFEVTPNKEIVWEYLSPFYYNRGRFRHGIDSSVFRAYRYSPDYPGLKDKVFNLQDPELQHLNQLYGCEAMIKANRIHG